MSEIICERCKKDLTKAVALLGNDVLEIHREMHEKHDLRQALVILGRLIDRGAVLKPGEEEIAELALRTFEAEKNAIFERIKDSCASHAEARRIAHGFILLSEQQREKRIKRKLGEE